MKEEFFDKLTSQEAKLFLDNFINVESKAVSELLNEANCNGINTDFTINSLSSVMRWALKKMKTIPIEPDPTVPMWILESETYKQNLFDFDEQSGKLLIRLAYYFGECFIRSFKKMKWATGNPKYVSKNMPVIRGFKKNMEMPPYMIVKNIMGAVLSGMESEECIEQAINWWRDNVLKN